MGNAVLEGYVKCMLLEGRNEPSFVFTVICTVSVSFVRGAQSPEPRAQTINSTNTKDQRHCCQHQDGAGQGEFLQSHKMTAAQASFFNAPDGNMNGEGGGEDTTMTPTSTLKVHPARRVFGSGSVHDLFKETDDVILAHQMHFDARAKSVSQITLAVFVFTFVFLVLSATLFVYAADISVRDAILYVMYTVTSAGFGTVPMPKDNKAFFFYLILFMYVGVFCTMSVVRTGQDPFQTNARSKRPFLTNAASSHHRPHMYTYMLPCAHR